jgi:hypothetical protein
MICLKYCAKEELRVKYQTEGTVYKMAKKTALQTTATDLIPQDMMPRELQALAENKSIEILQKINATTERIAEAKEVAENAANMKSGWFGKTGKKATATANAVVATNEALSEMNDLLKESIRFTCSSVQFAQVMHKTMAHMMVKGFKDTDGQIIKLSGDSKEVVQSILDEADDFVKKQLVVEEKQAEFHAKLDEKEKIDEEQNRRLEKLHTIFEVERSKVKNILDEKDKVDQEQSERLNEITAILDEKGEIDKKQEQAIQLLLDYTKQKDILDKEQSEYIQKIFEELKSGVVQRKIALVFSIIALVISISAAAFFALCLFL